MLRPPIPAAPTLPPPPRWGRVLALGLPLVVLNAGWIAHSEMRTRVTEITIETLFMGVTLLLFTLSLLNLGVRRWCGLRHAFTQAELLVLYGMLSLGTSIAGIGNLGFFTPFLGNVFRFASPSNNWDQWSGTLPLWIGPRDPAVLKGFYEGHSTFFQPEILRAWAVPLALWAVFFFVLLATLFCVAALVRRRWSDEEHLAFPVVALPLAMTAVDAPLYRQRLMWLGFAFPLVLHSLNTVAGLYPSLPAFPINTVWQGLEQVGQPWTGLGSVTIQLHPGAVGFGFLVNTDILLSLWVFFVGKKLLNLLGTQLGWRDYGPEQYGDGLPQFPFTGYQAWGAWLVVGLAALWTGRRYFQAAWIRALDGTSTLTDRDEALTPRQALIGLVGGFALLCSLVVALGAPTWVPVAMLGLYVLLMLALTRIEAETAVLSPLLGWVAPQDMLVTALGSGGLSQKALTHIAVLSWFNLDYRAAAMPQQLQALVGVRRAGVARLRPLVGVLALTALVGIVAALLWDLQLYYTLGAATADTNRYRLNMGMGPWAKLGGWLSQPKPPEPAAWVWAAIGAATTLLLTYLRTRFVGFPLAPSAYVLTTSFANELFWLDLFAAWLCKMLLLRYGGVRLYRNALPFFLGLLLGDFVTGAGWSLFGALTHLDLFRTFPN